MRFWDSSAIIPLIVKEEQTSYCVKALEEDNQMLAWSLSKVEVFSALCRRLRDGALNDDSFEKAKERLYYLFDTVFEVAAATKVKERALRLLQVHPLRAADALQLAAALVAVREEVHKMPLMCFDNRLTVAARREGFTVNLNLGSH